MSEIGLNEAINQISKIKNQYRAFEKVEEILKLVDKAERTIKSSEKSRQAIVEEINGLQDSLRAARDAHEQEIANLYAKSSKEKEKLRIERDREIDKIRDQVKREEAKLKEIVEQTQEREQMMKESIAQLRTREKKLNESVEKLSAEFAAMKERASNIG